MSSLSPLNNTENALVPTDDLEDEDDPDVTKRDLSWVTQFEITDQHYKDFYAEDISFVKFTAIYIDNSSNIIRTVQDTIFLSIPNILGRDE